jgi:hypothetical protein
MMVQRYRITCDGRLKPTTDDNSVVEYTEYAALEQRVRELAAEIAEPSIKELDVLYRIRQAVGDNGKMMQDELVDHIAGLSKKVRELEAELAGANKDIERLEPIEAAYNTYKEYPTSAIVKRDAYNKAINQCMEIGEGK